MAAESSQAGCFGFMAGCGCFAAVLLALLVLFGGVVVVL